jgi:inhibitor of KinA sporulation pathway (predicted exonuclease)
MITSERPFSASVARSCLPQFLRQELIEVSCCALDAGTLAVRSEFQRFVRPTEHSLLSAFCQQLTGIQQTW